MNIVKLKRLVPEAKLPTKGTEGSAYFDVYVAESCLLRVGETRALTTGWEIEVSKGFFLDIRSRSGLSIKGITIANAPGTVDEDFRGELKLVVHNSSYNAYHISLGDRLAQCALMPVVHTEFIEVSELSLTDRGRSGYGSTGR